LWIHLLVCLGVWWGVLGSPLQLGQKLRVLSHQEVGLRLLVWGSTTRGTPRGVTPHPPVTPWLLLHPHVLLHELTTGLLTPWWSWSHGTTPLLRTPTHEVALHPVGGLTPHLTIIGRGVSARPRGCPSPLLHHETGVHATTLEAGVAAKLLLLLLWVETHPLLHVEHGPTRLTADRWHTRTSLAWVGWTPHGARGPVGA